MEAINGSSNYMRIVQNGMQQLNFNTTICGLVTPPRSTMKSKRISMPLVDSHLHQYITPPPSKVPELQLSKSLPKCTRNSPSRLSPSQLDGKGFYAGAKFGKRPPPTELPKPPNHWVSLSDNKLWGSNEPSCIEMTNSLKVLLKVQS